MLEVMERLCLRREAKWSLFETFLLAGFGFKKKQGYSPAYNFNFNF